MRKLASFLFLAALGLGCSTSSSATPPPPCCAAALDGGGVECACTFVDAGISCSVTNNGSSCSFTCDKGDAGTSNHNGGTPVQTCQHDGG
jgi:hypothetical protein